MNAGGDLDLGQVQLIALDVDGTLAGADHRVSVYAGQVLRAVQERGLPPVLITGRSAPATTEIARSCGLSTPVICCNGAVIVRPDGSRMRVRSLEERTIAVVRRLSEESDLTLSLWTAEAVLVDRPGEMRDLLAQINGHEVPVVDPDDVEPDQVVKAMLLGPAEELDAHAAHLQEQVGGLTRSLGEMFEVVSPQATKLPSLQYGLAGYDLPLARCMGFGDAENDVEWLARVGTVVVPENAADNVRELAHLVVDHHRDDGVATFLAEALRAGLGEAGGPLS